MTLKKSSLIGAFVALLFGALGGVSPALAHPTFDVTLTPTSSGDGATGQLVLNLSTIPDNVNVASDVLSFSLTVNGPVGAGRVFNLSNGTISNLVFDHGSLTQMTYTGTIGGAAISLKLTIDFPLQALQYVLRSCGATCTVVGAGTISAPAVAVPEPSSLAMLAAGLLAALGFGVAGRRHRRVAAA